jgi:hypothetical protein
VGIDILKALFATAAVVSSHKMSGLLDCMTACARDDIGKSTLQAQKYLLKTPLVGSNSHFVQPPSQPEYLG